MGFYQQVYEVVARIPPGYVMGYGHIARYLGRPRAARHVGQAMAACPAGLAWYRVLRSDGSISYPLHPALQRSLLEAEGVNFLPDGKADMARHLWNPL